MSIVLTHFGLHYHPDMSIVAWHHTNIENIERTVGRDYDGDALLYQALSGGI